MSGSGLNTSLNLLFFSKSLLSFLFLVVPFGSQLVQAQAQEGFISLDCGFEGRSGYQDSVSGINYTGDSQYISSGKSTAISDNQYGLQYTTLRSFLNGTRNCYSLSPVQSGKRYLVRAGFYYGNYDGKNVYPIFHLYIGVNFWTSVGMNSDGPAIFEIITVPRGENLEVCLVDTSTGTPFISLLELRPLLDIMYPLADEYKSLRKEYRWNYGIQDQLRFPKDPFDRIWEGIASGFDLLNTTEKVQSKPTDPFQVPLDVLQTAITISKLGDYLTSRTIEGKPREKAYIAMHFAELLKLNSSESRKLNIFGVDGNSLLFSNYIPIYLVADHKEIFNAAIGDSGSYIVAIHPANSSTRPYMINALESFIIRLMNESQTADSDVVAIENVKKAFKLTRNWESDPCSPRRYTWEGVGCNYDDSPTARITSLNLSSSGLEGEIPSSIGDLTALVTLDLSNNNLSGSIPGTLGEISSLRDINLSGNKALGSIPPSLCDKVSKGSLSISAGQGQCQTSRKSNNAIVISISVVASLIFLGLLAFLWFCCRRSKSVSTPDDREIAVRETGVKTSKKDVRFSFEEITGITHNFNREIGKGGFGVVYFGSLKDETKVAVKVISSTSSQGSREFEAEVVLLTRVHHRNLVCLLGYCDEKDHLSLVYEYMDNGNLRDHLSGAIASGRVLNWKQRVSIALQAAQGLDYLHNGCRPPIIHRDIKSSNILINSEFVAKISDFGLSRDFYNSGATHVTTAVAGTPGYLDPEYFQTCELNEKSDAYSFGVVLLEIITGQPLYEKSEKKTHIVPWVRSRLETGDIDSIVDARLRGDFDVNVAWNLVEVALSCTSKASQERMAMSDVVVQLKQCMDKSESRSLLTETEFSLPTQNHLYMSGDNNMSSPQAR